MLWLRAVCLSPALPIIMCDHHQSPRPDVEVSTYHTSDRETKSDISSESAMLNPYAYIEAMYVPCKTNGSDQIGFPHLSTCTTSDASKPTRITASSGERAEATENLNANHQSHPHANPRLNRYRVQWIARREQQGTGCSCESS